MDQQEIIDRLRNPAKYRNHPPHAPGAPAVIRNLPGQQDGLGRSGRSDHQLDPGFF